MSQNLENLIARQENNTVINIITNKNLHF